MQDLNSVVGDLKERWPQLCWLSLAVPCEGFLVSKGNLAQPNTQALSLLVPESSLAGRVLAEGSITCTVPPDLATSPAAERLLWDAVTAARSGARILQGWPVRDGQGGSGVLSVGLSPCMAAPAGLQQDLQRLLALVTRQLEALAQPMREGAAAFVGLGALEGSQAAVRRMHTPHPAACPPAICEQDNLHTGLNTIRSLRIDPGVGELPPCRSEGTPQPGHLLQRPASNVCELEAQQEAAPRGPDDSDLGGASSLRISEVQGTARSSLSSRSPSGRGSSSSEACSSLMHVASAAVLYRPRCRSLGNGIGTSAMHDHEELADLVQSSSAPEGSLDSIRRLVGSQHCPAPVQPWGSPFAAEREQVRQEQGRGLVDKAAAAFSTWPEGLARPTKAYSDPSVLQTIVVDIKASALRLTYRNPVVQQRYQKWYAEQVARRDFLGFVMAILIWVALAVGPLKLHHSSQLHSPAIGVQFAALGALVLHPVWYKAHRAAVLSALILFLGLHLCTVVSPSVVAAVGPARVATDPLYFARANAVEGLILLGLFFPLQFAYFLPVQLLNVAAALVNTPSLCNTLPMGQAQCWAYSSVSLILLAMAGPVALSRWQNIRYMRNFEHLAVVAN